MIARRPDRILFVLALLLGGLVAAWGPAARQAQAHGVAAVTTVAIAPGASVSPVSLAVSPAEGVPVNDHACPDSRPSHELPGWHRASCRRLTRWLGDGAVPDAAPGSIPPVPVFVGTGNAKPAAVVSRPGSGFAPRAAGPRAPPAQH